MNLWLNFPIISISVKPFVWGIHQSRPAHSPSPVWLPSECRCADSRCVKEQKKSRCLSSGTRAGGSTSEVTLVELSGAFGRSQLFLTTADVIPPRPSEQSTFLRRRERRDDIELARHYLHSHLEPSSWGGKTGEECFHSLKMKWFHSLIIECFMVFLFYRLTFVYLFEDPALWQLVPLCHIALSS